MSVPSVDRPLHPMPLTVNNRDFHLKVPLGQAWERASILSSAQEAEAEEWQL